MSVTQNQRNRIQAIAQEAAGSAVNGVLKYGVEHDDKEGPWHLVNHAINRVVSGDHAKANRAELVVAAGLLLNAIATIDRAGGPLPLSPSLVVKEGDRIRMTPPGADVGLTPGRIIEGTVLHSNDTVLILTDSGRFSVPILLDHDWTLEVL